MSAPAPGTAYERYIRGAAWRRSPARLGELQAADGRCRLCDRGAPEARVEVHHRSYARLGCERPGDLCCLCRDCHLLVTSELRRRRHAAAPVAPPRESVRARAGRDLTDPLLPHGRADHAR